MSCTVADTVHDGSGTPIPGAVILTCPVPIANVLSGGTPFDQPYPAAITDSIGAFTVALSNLLTPATARWVLRIGDHQLWEGPQLPDGTYSLINLQANGWSQIDGTTLPNDVLATLGWGVPGFRQAPVTVIGGSGTGGGGSDSDPTATTSTLGTVMVDVNPLSGDPKALTQAGYPHGAVRLNPSAPDTGNTQVTGEAAAGDVKITGLHGVTSFRLVDVHDSGPPTAGAYQTGDITLDRTTPALWLCITPGTPGIWTRLSSGGVLLYGIAAGKPTVSSVSDGTVYCETDQGEALWQVQSGAWVQITYGTTIPVATPTTIGGVEVDVAATTPVAITQAGLARRPLADATKALLRFGDAAFAGSTFGTILGIALAGDPTVSHYEQTVLADAPVLYWPLDDAVGSSSTTDLSGNSFTGTVSGAVTFGVPGAIQAADTAAACASGAYIWHTAQPTTVLPYFGSPRTVELWVKTGVAGVIFDQSGNSANNVQMALFTVTLNSTTLQLDIQNSIYGTPRLFFATATNPLNNAWHHVAVTYDGSTITAYLDGVSLGGQGPYALNTDSISVQLRAGFAGTIDDVAVYGHALSAARVSAHYVAGTTPGNDFPGDLLAYSVAGTLFVHLDGNGNLSLVGEAAASDFAASGLNGVTTAGRNVGTTNGSPTGGPWRFGDYATDPTTKTVWLCTVAGSPGTWVQIKPAPHATSHLAGGTDPLAWTTINAQDTFAHRPAAATTNAGYTYYATDIGILYRSTGSAWTVVAQAGTGAALPTATSDYVGTLFFRTSDTTLWFCNATPDWVQASSSGGGGGTATGASVNKVQLDYAVTTTYGDYGTGAGTAAATWTNLFADQSFLVDDAASLVTFEAAAGLQAKINTGGAHVSAALLIDGTTRHVLGTQWSTGAYMNPFAGSRPIEVQGLTAGSHTARLQVYTDTAGTVICDPPTYPNSDFIKLKIVEHKVVPTGASGTLDMARCHFATPPTITSGTDTALQFDTNDYDTNTLHSTSVNPTRITIKTAGKYAFGGNAEFAANATGIRQITIYKNGTVPLVKNTANAVAGGGPTQLVVAEEAQLAVGDYLEMNVYQTSGGGLALDANNAGLTNFWVQRADGYAVNTMTTAGDMQTATTGGAPQRIAAGTQGMALQMGATTPAWQWMQARTKAGAPVDGDFASPTDGLVVVDTTNSKLWARIGGVWKGVVLT